MSVVLVLISAAVCGASGLPAVVLGRDSNRGQAAAAFFSVAGSVLGLYGVGVYLLRDAAPVLFHSVPIPAGPSTSLVGLDGLSALFLVPVFLITGAGAVYGLGYWRQSENIQNGRKLRLFYGLLSGGMALLLIARSSVLFLTGWELMALSAYFLVATDDRAPSVRQAAWTYLIATHLGTMALLALFALIGALSGSLDWSPLHERYVGSFEQSAIFLLALLGFGLKAGIMPFHVWLPSAHASAPSHVSAVLSGVMIKMGAYGILRISGYLPRSELWWGVLLLVLGMASGIIGIAAAIGQRDLKRMLAYSSIENMGIISMGIGLALMGRYLGERRWVVLGLGGALFHVLNHGLFKPLLFFSAGSVVHAAHTREVDSLGGLARRMPLSFIGFVVGAWAICGLPVLNGFMSELLLYLGLFEAAIPSTAGVSLLAALAAAGLGLIGALAIACFVRAVGTVFLGTARSSAAAGAVEGRPSMTGVMVVLAVLCFALGVIPLGAAHLVDRALSSWGEGFPLPISEAAPLRQAGLFALFLAVLTVLGSGLLRLRSGARVSSGDAVPTWDCGYAGPVSPRIQYTGSSLGQVAVGLFSWAVRMEEKRPSVLSPFPAAMAYESRATEPLLDRCLNPFCRRWADRFMRFRIFQRGKVQIYLIYILVTLVIVIAWAMLSPRIVP